MLDPTWSSRECLHNPDLAVRPHRIRQPPPIGDLLSVHEDRDVMPHAPLLAEQVRPQRGHGREHRLQSLAHGAAVDALGDRLRELPQMRGEADRGHRGRILVLFESLNMLQAPWRTSTFPSSASGSGKRPGRTPGGLSRSSTSSPSGSVSGTWAGASCSPTTTGPIPI